jgi:hypothetical protein
MVEVEEAVFSRHPKEEKDATAHTPTENDATAATTGYPADMVQDYISNPMTEFRGRLGSTQRGAEV